MSEQDLSFESGSTSKPRSETVLKKIGSSSFGSYPPISPCIISTKKKTLTYRNLISFESLSEVLFSTDEVTRIAETAPPVGQVERCCMAEEVHE